MTEAERRLWRVLRGRRFANTKLRRQHEFGPYVLDFYCVQLGLAVEVDGGQHNEPEGLASDAERDAYLLGHGVRVVRFSNLDVFANLDGVVRQIQEIVAGGPSPHPSPKGRGGSRLGVDDGDD
jgi:very-short-patch-repair endonuclease